MAPGGGVCKEVFESHPTFANYDIIKPKVEKNSTPLKSVTVMGGKHGMPLSNSVHELLVCPVCSSLMYRPIHQVCLWF